MGIEILFKRINKFNGVYYGIDTSLIKNYNVMKITNHFPPCKQIYKVQEYSDYNEKDFQFALKACDIVSVEIFF